MCIRDRVYLELERRLRAANAMDFDDLLVRTLELLRLSLIHIYRGQGYSV